MADTNIGTPTQLQFDSGTGASVIYPETITESVLVEDEDLQDILGIKSEEGNEDKNLLNGLKNLSDNKRLIAVTLDKNEPKSPIAGDIWYEII